MLRVWEDRSPETEQVVKIHTFIGWQEQHREIWMDGRPHPSDHDRHTWKRSPELLQRVGSEAPEEHAFTEDRVGNDEPTCAARSHWFRGAVVKPGENVSGETCFAVPNPVARGVTVVLEPALDIRASTAQADDQT